MEYLGWYCARLWREKGKSKRVSCELKCVDSLTQALGETVFLLTTPAAGEPLESSSMHGYCGMQPCNWAGLATRVLQRQKGKQGIKRVRERGRDRERVRERMVGRD